MFSTRKTFIDKLREQMTNPQIAAFIRKTDDSRLFDVPAPEFDVVFADTKTEAYELANILKKLNAREDTNQGVIFATNADRTAVSDWAKRFISRICTELLTEDNQIKPELLELIGKTPATISSRMIVSAYFSTASQYIAKLVTASEAAKEIKASVFTAFLLYQRHASDWVKEVLKERMIMLRKKNGANAAILDDDIFTVGAPVSLFGLFVMGGSAAYKYLTSHNEPHREEEPDSNADLNGPPRGWYSFE